MPSKERYPLSFYLIVAANLFYFSGFQWTFATLPGYVQEIGGGPAQIGLAFGLFSFSALAARPPVGWLVDHWGRKPVLLIGAAIFTIAPVLYVFTVQIWPFMVVRVFHGLGIAAFTTAYTALVADLAPEGRRGEAIGISGITNNLGLLFAPALGLLVVSTWGWATHFWLSAVITAVSVLVLLPIVEPRRSSSEGADHLSFGKVARLRPVWVASVGITGLAVAYGAVLGFLSPFAADRGLSAAGGYFSAFAAAMISGQIFAGRWSDRHGRRAVAIPGMALTVIAMIGLGLASSDPVMILAGAIFGLSWGLARTGIDTAVVEAVASRERGSAVGFLYVCFDVGVTAGSFGLGVLAGTRGYASVFFASSIWAVVALLIYVFMGRTSRATSDQAGTSNQNLRW